MVYLDKIMRLLRDAGFVYFCTYLGGIVMTVALGRFLNGMAFSYSFVFVNYFISAVCFYFVLHWAENKKAVHLGSVVGVLMCVSLTEFILQGGELMHGIGSVVMTCAVAGCTYFAYHFASLRR